MAGLLTRIQWIASAALVGLGGFVMLGWLNQQAWMVQLQPGLIAMVFNTAFCFLLAGAGLAGS